MKQKTFDALQDAFVRDRGHADFEDPDFVHTVREIEGRPAPLSLPELIEAEHAHLKARGLSDEEIAKRIDAITEMLQ